MNVSSVITCITYISIKMFYGKCWKTFMSHCVQVVLDVTGKRNIHGGQRRERKRKRKKERKKEVL